MKRTTKAATTAGKKSSIPKKQANTSSGSSPSPISYLRDVNTIPVADAVTSTKAWRFFNEYPEPANHTTVDFIRAFRLPVGDITKLAKMAAEMNFVSFRAYIGMQVEPSIVHPNDDGRYMKLYLVGVLDIDGKETDLITLNGDSCIFDLSTPCPNTCDHESILYRDPV